MKTNNHNLVVFGDSWGRGAWTLPDETLLHATQGDNYFSEKWQEHFNSVENFSKGGSANVNSIISMMDYLQTETILSLRENKKKILVIQTEPMRDAIPQINFGNVSPYYPIFKDSDYKAFNETLINFFYFNLNEIGKKFKTRINLTGGCSDVNISLARQYAYINVCCESFYGLIDTMHTPTIFSVTHDVSKAMQKMTKSNVFVVDSIAKKQGIQSEYQRDLFGYGLDNHPSRKGIDIWVSHMSKNMK